MNDVPKSVDEMTLEEAIDWYTLRTIERCALLAEYHHAPEAATAIRNLARVIERQRNEDLPKRRDASVDQDNT